MKHLLALAILIAVLPGCKESHAANETHVDGFKVDYFTKDFYTYVNDNGWTVKRAGLWNGVIRYNLSHGNSHVEILMDYDQQAELATTFEFSFPKGSPAAEALLQEILGSVDGIERFAKEAMAKQDKERVRKSDAEQEASTGQPATRPELKSEAGDKPQPEAEGRSR